MQIFLFTQIVCVFFAGSISLSGEEYVTAVIAFIESLTLDMTASEALRLSYSITSVSTTLTEEQVTVQRPSIPPSLVIEFCV